MASAVASKTAPAPRWARVDAGQAAVVVGYDAADRILRSAPADRISDLLEALRRDCGVDPIAGDQPPPAVVAAARRALAGAPGAMISQARLTAFQQRVLEATAMIRPGERLTYGELARQIGSPGAARAVGSALAANPFPALVPCHRVVHADGSIGQYSCGGSRVKERLLAEEASASSSASSGASSG